MQRSVWNDNCELANKTTQQLYKVSTPCIDDHHFKEEETKSVGELSNTCSQIVLKCLYLARIARPDILWSVNKLARSITKWTKACDKRLNRLISYIHHTCEYKQYCHVGNTAKQCRPGLFQDSDFAGDLEDSKSTSGGTLCIFGSHTFVPTSWMCKKQSSVSHSSTESEIISLDAVLRFDGVPALDLWDLIVFVLKNTVQTLERPERPVVSWSEICSPPHTIHKRKQSHGMINYLDNVDFILSNVQSSHQEALWYVFEANEAVIKMMIKGRSLAMMEDRTGRLVVTAQHTDRFIVENEKMNSYTEAESELSLESRSFSHRVNDQVRRKQNQSSKDATKDSDKHSVIWRMFMFSTLESSVLMVKNYSDNWHSIKNTKDFTMKQIFDISEKLITEQSDEINGMSTVNWELSSWKYLSLIGDEQVISLSHANVHVFSDSLFCLGKMNENPQSHMAWEDRLTWFRSLSEDRTLDRINGEPMEFEWKIFPGFTTLQLSHEVKVLLLKFKMKHQKTSLDGSSSCRCSTTSHGDLKTTRKNASQMLNSSLSMQKDLEQDNGHFSVLVQRKVVFYQWK